MMLIQVHIIKLLKKLGSLTNVYFYFDHDGVNVNLINVGHANDGLFVRARIQIIKWSKCKSCDKIKHIKIEY